MKRERNTIKNQKRPGLITEIRTDAVTSPMKAIRLHQIARPQSLRYEDAAKPSPKDNEILIQVHATAVTPSELEWYPTSHTADGGTRRFPIILGHEFSGVVSAMGSACAGVEVGDAVYGLNDWFLDGAQAEYCLTVAASIAPKPHTLDHVQAAAVPISALTAWQALIDRAHLSAGQRVLIQGAAGGVGSFAVQMARHQKAHVIATALAANTDFVKALGADEVIDYQITPFETVVADVDVVLDTVGGGWSRSADEDDRDLVSANVQFTLEIESGHARHGDVED